MEFFKKLFGKKEPEMKPDNGNVNQCDSRPVWINALGRVECPGDACPLTCDETCPVFCSSLAMRLSAQNNDVEAIKLHAKALAMEPRITNSWSALGVFYGQLGNHEEAYKCFKKMYELGKRDQTVIKNLLIACENTKRPDEGLKFCNEFDAYNMTLSNKFRTTFYSMKGE